MDLEHSALGWAHPIVRDWFLAKFGSPTEPQAKGWPHILARPAVQMRQVLPESVLEEFGRLDPAAIAQVQQEAWPDVRDPDELHDALLTFVALPETFKNVIPSEDAAIGERPDFGREHAASESRDLHLSERNWSQHLAPLLASGRAGVARVNGQTFWVAAERAQAFRVVYRNATFDSEPAAIDHRPSTIDHRPFRCPAAHAHRLDAAPGAYYRWRTGVFARAPGERN
jgi:hypothetical protein